MIPSASNGLPFPAADETLDRWGPGRLQILQKKNGYRFAIDTMILADFIRLKLADRVLDLGTGCGILPLLLAAQIPRGRLIGLEVQPGLLDLAARNLRLNHRQGLIHLVRGDMRTVPALFREACLDAVITNPPYRALKTGRVNPNEEKALARHEILVDLPQILQGVRRILKDKGHFFLIYPARRLAGLIFEARRSRLEPKRLRLVHSFPESDGEWVLLEAVKYGGEELTILPPLTVYEGPGVYSPEVRRILER
ncbi:MAG: methyltransferase [Deltaproteobacteria bacterium]|nr:methyltransferase [Deltaproteobacteria bacterium]